MVCSDNGCFIAVGGNLSPQDSIPAALHLLGKKCRLRQISTFYRTKAINRPEQPDYLNGVVHVEYSGDPRSLKFEVLRLIEDALGRVRTKDSYAARTIDLDILLFGSLVINEPGLVIPDPDICCRPFLAADLAELLPDCVLQGTTLKIEKTTTDQHERWFGHAFYIGIARRFLL